MPVTASSKSLAERATQPKSEWRARAGSLWLPIAIGFVALLLYLPGCWWGIPYPTATDRAHSWGVDSPMPLGPLADVYNLFRPQPDRNLGYPLMHSFLVDAAYTPYLAYLRLTGALAHASAIYPFGLVDAVGTLRTMALIANLLSVLMAVGVVVAAYDTGRVLWDRNTGILSALFAMVVYPMFYYSRTGNVDMAVLFFTALALDIFARCLVQGLSASRAAWMAVFVGCALGTKEPSFASFLGVVLVLVPLHWRNLQSRGEGLSWSFWKPIIVAVICVVVVFGFTSGMFISPERFIAHVQFARSRVQLLANHGVSYLPSYPFTMQGHLGLLRVIGEGLLSSMTLPALLLACIGMVWTFRRERLTSAFALPAFTYLAVLFWSARAAQLHFLIPVAFTFAFFAARAIVLAGESGSRTLAYAMAAMGVFAGGLGLLRGIDLTYAMVKDSRYEAGKWLETHSQGSNTVETFGPPSDLPRLKSGIRTAQPVERVGVSEPRLDEEAIHAIVEGWRTRKPDFVIIMPDYTSAAGAPYSLYCPPSVYEALLNEKLGYRLAASFETDDLFPWARRPALDYPSVNPPIRIFARDKESAFWNAGSASATSEQSPQRRSIQGFASAR